MNFIFEILSEKNEKILKSKGLSNESGIDYLKEKLFLISIEIIIFVGTIAYLPSVFIAISEKQFSIVLIDTLLMFSIFVLFFLKRLKLIIRISILLSFIYAVGVILLANLSLKGTGLIYLMAFSVIASTFMGMKVAIASLFINLFTLLGFAFFIVSKSTIVPIYETYSLGRWVVIAINFCVVNSVISLAIAYFVESLKKSFERELDLKQKLKKKSERLIEAKVRAEESDQLKTAFLANVSHEFRTPMNAIVGFTEIMLFTNTDEEKRKRYLKNILKSSEQLLQIINNTIEYSKIELGSIEFKLARFEIYEVLNIVFENLRPKCPSGIDFLLSGYLGINMPRIVSDREKMIQVFTNLILNAFKFTEKGSVSFGLMESAHPNYYQFFVKDTGIGIRKEKQKDIFTRFHKEDDFKEGTGLGLSISATLVFHMGGRIWLESEPGAGTTFYFILPTELSKKIDV
ncbi:MAG: hypothetical protein JXB34_00565 [Bacteroidales bacterium]|nr:hypothetical protein [Bacteroidales bacterium]